MSNVEPYKEIRTKVRGVTRTDPRSGRDRQEIIKQYVRKGTRLTARHEPNNPADPNAISIWVEKKGFIGKQFRIGYLSRERAAELAPYIHRGVKLRVIVINVTGGTRDRPTRGVNIAIHVPA